MMHKFSYIVGGRGCGKRRRQYLVELLLKNYKLNKYCIYKTRPNYIIKYNFKENNNG